MNIKQLAGEKATEFIETGMVVGLGTGSTAFYFVEKLGMMVQAGLDIQGVPTSLRTEEQATRLGIPLLALREVERIDVVVDGADEFDPDFHLIKGGGGALYREKMIASLSKEMIVVAGENKSVETLGAFPLPIEVVPFGFEVTQKRLEQLGLHPQLRSAEGQAPFLTDNGNYILDCFVGSIPDPAGFTTGWLKERDSNGDGLLRWPSVDYVDIANYIGLTQPDFLKRLQSS